MKGGACLLKKQIEEEVRMNKLYGNWEDLRCSNYCKVENTPKYFISSYSEEFDKNATLTFIENLNGTNYGANEPNTFVLANKVDRLRGRTGWSEWCAYSRWWLVVNTTQFDNQLIWWGCEHAAIFFYNLKRIRTKKTCKRERALMTLPLKMNGKCLCILKL